MDDFARRLAALDSCAVSDAKDSLSLPPAVSGISRRSSQQQIAGRVITVRLEAVDNGSSSAPRPGQHLCTAAIESGGPGSVIVVQQRTGVDAGSWGGVLSQAAHQRGIEGVIIEGPSRDIDEARQIGFPVFARGTTARTARGRIVEAETGGAITVGDENVNNGDYVIADDSGVVFIAAAQIERVLQAAEQIADRESQMVQALLSGKPVSEVMGTEYEQMLRPTDDD